MSVKDRQAIDALTDRLAVIMAANGIAVERQMAGIAVAGLDLSVTVETAWDDLGTPPRIFGVEIGIHSATLFGGMAREYSYGAGGDMGASMQMALERWAHFDLPVLIVAAGGSAEHCQHMTLESDGRRGMAAGTWQIVMGPLYFLAQESVQPCCQSCLMTMSLPALMPALAEPLSCGIALFAAKQGNGNTVADFRRNGVDMPDIAGAMREAAKAWPAMPTTQMRRQYLYFKAPSEVPERAGPLRRLWRDLSARRRKLAA